MKRFILFIVIISLSFALYVAVGSITGHSYLLQSSTDCCSILVEDVDVTADDVIVYHIRYTHDNGVEHSFVEEPELDAEINMYQEYCYAHHN